MVYVYIYIEIVFPLSPDVYPAKIPRLFVEADAKGERIRPCKEEYKREREKREQKYGLKKTRNIYPTEIRHDVKIQIVLIIIYFTLPSVAPLPSEKAPSPLSFLPSFLPPRSRPVLAGKNFSASVHSKRRSAGKPTRVEGRAEGTD